MLAYNRLFPYQNPRLNYRINKLYAFSRSEAFYEEYNQIILTFKYT